MRLGNHKDRDKYNACLHAEEPIINTPTATGGGGEDPLDLVIPRNTSASQFHTGLSFLVKRKLAPKGNSSFSYKTTTHTQGLVFPGPATFIHLTSWTAKPRSRR